MGGSAGSISRAGSSDVRASAARRFSLDPPRCPGRKCAPRPCKIFIGDKLIGDGQTTAVIYFFYTGALLTGAAPFWSRHDRRRRFRL